MLGRRCLSHPLFSTTIVSLNGLAAIHLWLRSASPLKATEGSGSMPRPARMEAYFSCNRRYAASGLAPKVSLYAW